LHRIKAVARTTKKRAQQLKHDKFRDTTFDAYAKPDLDKKDPWQFKNFLVSDAG